MMREVVVIFTKDPSNNCDISHCVADVIEIPDWPHEKLQAWFDEIMAQGVHPNRQMLRELSDTIEKED